MMNGPVAQLNRASDYGSEGYRFESCRDHKEQPRVSGVFYFEGIHEACFKGDLKNEK